MHRIIFRTTDSKCEYVIDIKTKRDLRDLPLLEDPLQTMHSSDYRHLPEYDPFVF